MGGLPSAYTGGTDDRTLSEVFNPITRNRDITARIYGERLLTLCKRRVNPRQYLIWLKETLQDPTSVFLGIDDDYLYFRDIGSGFVFYARMRPSDCYVFVWDREPSDPADLAVPLAKDSGRVKSRLY